MYRVKVALIAASLVFAMTMLVFARVTGSASESILQAVEGNVGRAQLELARSSRLDGVDLASQAAAYAREDEFIQIFTKGNDNDKKTAAHIAAEARNARLEQSGRKAGIIGVVDDQGLLVSRDLNPAWRYRDNFKKDYPSLGMALTGQANNDVWNLDGAMYRVGAAPIRGPQGNVLGAVFVGYTHSSRDALDAKNLVGADVAYFLDGKIHASSFQRTESQSSESGEEKALAEQLFDKSDKSRISDIAVSTDGKPKLFRVQMSGEEWVAVAALFPSAGPGGNATPSKAGFVALQSVTSAKKPLAPIGTLVLALGLIGILAVVGAAVMTARRFLNPLDSIEAGVAEVINGNRDYVFESPSPDFEGLANGLNVMLARLLGRPEPDDEDEGNSASLRALESTRME